MRILLLAVLGVSVLSGCGRALGLERDYVLTKPLVVQLDGTEEKITLPVGTKVTAQLLKHPVYRVELTGYANDRPSGEQ